MHTEALLKILKSEKHFTATNLSPNYNLVIDYRNYNLLKPAEATTAIPNQKELHT
jgi:hypothetical protein